MMDVPASGVGGYLSAWWHALLHPDAAASLVLGRHALRRFNGFLILCVALMYGFYGLSMGLFRGVYPGAVAGLKLPFMYLFSLFVCFPALYVSNCIGGPRLNARQCATLLILAISVNAAALTSYSLVSYFFTLTAKRVDYSFIVLMHVGVFALAGVLSVTQIGLIFNATARAQHRPPRRVFVLGWAMLYALVGMQMSWLLRPWIGSYSVPYTPLRPIESSFFESVFTLLFSR